MTKIIPAFLGYASDILADTQSGLSGSEIVKYFRSKSLEYNTDIPHTKSPLTEVANKRTAFLENLEKFNSEQQFEIIDELTVHPKLEKVEAVIKLRKRLFSGYSKFSKQKSIIDDELITSTIHWLEKYPDAFKCYGEGLEKYKSRIYERNLLDDFRLSLELLLRHLLNNSKSLENQLNDLGKFQNDRGMSSETTNMFIKLLDYYSKYQNNYVKHNDKVNANEIDFIVNLTSTFMQYLIK